jgi:hypothetical protein
MSLLTSIGRRDYNHFKNASLLPKIKNCPFVERSLLENRSFYLIMPLQNILEGKMAAVLSMAFSLLRMSCLPVLSVSGCPSAAESRNRLLEEATLISTDNRPAQLGVPGTGVREGAEGQPQKPQNLQSHCPALSQSGWPPGSRQSGLLGRPAQPAQQWLPPSLCL